MLFNASNACNARKEPPRQMSLQAFIDSKPARGRHAMGMG